jgi:hypothetical protein
MQANIDRKQPEKGLLCMCRASWYIFFALIWTQNFQNLFILTSFIRTTEDARSPSPRITGTRKVKYIRNNSLYAFCFMFLCAELRNADLIRIEASIHQATDNWSVQQ